MNQVPSRKLRSSVSNFVVLVAIVLLYSCWGYIYLACSVGFRVIVGDRAILNLLFVWNCETIDVEVVANGVDGEYCPSKVDDNSENKVSSKIPQLYRGGDRRPRNHISKSCKFRGKEESYNPTTGPLTKMAPPINGNSMTVQYG